MAEGPHMIACYVDGEWTDTVGSDMVAQVLGMSETKVRMHARTTREIRGTGIRLVDITDWPGGRWRRRET